MRYVFSLLAGSIFGLGLLISGMTDTAKVRGWLDFFGDWDPTLAFVLGGAILPMAVAWRVTGRLRLSALGSRFPRRPAPELDRNLVVGSLMFGLGWGLAGFCPGPALAALGFGGTGAAVFFVSMLAGMAVARPIGIRLAAV
ncbi:MAG: DUF6691 family protein [Paracoccaceae bacterium]